MTSTIQLLYSNEAEQSVLGGLLINNDLWDEISLIINENNFYISAHKLIFTTIAGLLLSNIPADLLTVSRILEEQGKLEQIGSFVYLAELIKNLPHISNISAYAKIVRTDSQTKYLYALGDLICKEARKVNTEDKLNFLITETEKRLTELTLNSIESETNVVLDDAIEKVIDKMTIASENGSIITGTPFRIERLDFNTTGAQDGDLIMVTARPSMGKTALSLTFAKSALESTNKPVHHFSLEMPAEQIMQRFLSMISKVEMQKARQAVNMTQIDWGKIC